MYLYTFSYHLSILCFESLKVNILETDAKNQTMPDSEIPMEENQLEVAHRFQNSTSLLPTSYLPQIHGQRLNVYHTQNTPLDYSQRTSNLTDISQNRPMMAQNIQPDHRVVSQESDAQMITLTPMPEQDSKSRYETRTSTSTEEHMKEFESLEMDGGELHGDQGL